MQLICPKILTIILGREYHKKKVPDLSHNLSIRFCNLSIGSWERDRTTWKNGQKNGMGRGPLWWSLPVQYLWETCNWCPHMLVAPNSCWGNLRCFDPSRAARESAGWMGGKRVCEGQCCISTLPAGDPDSRRCWKRVSWKGNTNAYRKCMGRVCLVYRFGRDEHRMDALDWGGLDERGWEMRGSVEKLDGSARKGNIEMMKQELIRGIWGDAWKTLCL